ncbi:LiaG family protein [Bacillus infantis]|uniref:LiaG family protein n=1 Tax=Bacillus infantis TaxID=324767 RepID=UPI003CF56011
MKKIILLFLVITGLYLAFTSFSHFSWLGLGANGKEKASAERVSRIEVNVSGVETTIIQEERDTVEAVLDGKGEVNVKKNGRTIKVDYKRKWPHWFGGFEKTELSIYIPQDYDKDLDINLGSGDFDFAGNEPIKLRDVSLDMSSGDVMLGDLQVREFELNGASGELFISSLKAEEADLEISSGSTTIDSLEGKLEAGIASGELGIKMKKLAAPIDLDVSSGDVQLDLPDNASFTLDAHYSSGDIHADVPMDQKEVKDNRISGINKEGKHEIKVDVSSGDVSIY